MTRAAASREPELHVAGLVVHAYPEAAERIAHAIGRREGARIHARSPDGKLVVTLEAEGSEAIAASVADIQRIEGVLAASLVYQHSESVSAMQDEVDL
jgi:nitrate reductase NapD